MLVVGVEDKLDVLLVIKGLTDEFDALADVDTASIPPMPA